MFGQVGRATIAAGLLVLIAASCGSEFKAKDDSDMTGGEAGSGSSRNDAGEPSVIGGGGGGAGDDHGESGQGPTGGTGGAPSCECAADQVCDDGACVAACADHETDCDGCVDTQTDVNHCGGCDQACEVGMDCVEGECTAACEDSLRQPLTDIWGQVWDGLERAADTLANAQAACGEGRARLPTVTELYRVSATQSATVGQSNHTTYLWSATPRDPAAQMTVRLSDGASVAYATVAANTRNYRCTCPAPRSPIFDDAACNGPPGASCFAFGGESGRYNMDIRDRPPLPKSAAIWECQHENAHLADFIVYAEAIQAKLPNGSGAWLHTADDAQYANGTVVKWAGAPNAWAVTGNTSIGVMSSPLPFRCVGLNYEPGVNPVEMDGAFIERASGYKSDGADRAVATFVAAHDACFDAGGHLARSVELGNLITAGLPGGTGQVVWASDAAGYGTNQFLTMVAQWTGALSIFPYANTGVASGNITWAYKANPGYPFRCIYYPIDEELAGPADADCNGGCFEIAAGDGPATIWFDKLDRAPAPLEAGVAACAAQGGRLASERDYTEAIRHGLPGGTGAFLLSWDIAWGSTNPGLHHTVVRWTGEEPAFADLSPANMTWSAPATARPYRCMWTNELR
jgi:hypothetical protein